jgi:hypothetical protein
MAVTMVDTWKVFIVVLILWVAVTTWSEGFHEFVNQNFFDGKTPHYAYIFATAIILTALLFYISGRFNIDLVAVVGGGGVSTSPV